MDLYKDKINHDRELNAKELEIINEISKLIKTLEEDIHSMKSDIEVLKGINFYEIVNKDLPKSDELKVLVDILEKNAKVSKNLSNLTRRIMELYQEVNKEII